MGWVVRSPRNCQTPQSVSSQQLQANTSKQSQHTTHDWESLTAVHIRARPAPPSSAHGQRRSIEPGGPSRPTRICNLPSSLRMHRTWSISGRLAAPLPFRLVRLPIGRWSLHRCLRLRAGIAEVARRLPPLLRRLGAPVAISQKKVFSCFMALQGVETCTKSEENERRGKEPREAALHHRLGCVGLLFVRRMCHLSAFQHSGIGPVKGWYHGPVLY